MTKGWHIKQFLLQKQINDLIIYFHYFLPHTCTARPPRSISHCSLCVILTDCIKKIDIAWVATSVADRFGHSTGYDEHGWILMWNGGTLKAYTWPATCLSTLKHFLALSFNFLTSKGAIIYTIFYPAGVKTADWDYKLNRAVFAAVTDQESWTAFLYNQRRYPLLAIRSIAGLGNFCFDPSFQTQKLHPCYAHDRTIPSMRSISNQPISVHAHVSLKLALSSSFRCLHLSGPFCTFCHH